ncbi:MAG: hypothetical protein K0U42_09405 [Actinomycetia bacterium]|nr:hypothetical protein [Actinomycetes bacterium]MCH9831183.1 hypothetical protein [Actinomycetes bacterium]MCH9841548.1 hypothetical protein [Actinomycetes bacterium]
MVIDCGTCVMSGPACGDCVVTVLLGEPEFLRAPAVAEEHLAALSVLAQSGLVPPLRLVSEESQTG